MIKSFVCVCGLLVSLNVVAASLKPVKGKVVDRFNNPLPGATIQVTHSPEKTITDVDGNFNFETIEDAELIVSYIGFRTLKLKTAGENFIHVVLDEDSQLLNDVVVVGYSTNKKVNLSGSVSSLNSEKLASRRVSNVSSALQGMAAGVTVTTQSGEPGGNGGHIRIRGIGTFGGDSAAPLVLVDGVEGTVASANVSDSFFDGNGSQYGFGRGMFPHQLTAFGIDSVYVCIGRTEHHYPICSSRCTYNACVCFKLPLMFAVFQRKTGKKSQIVAYINLVFIDNRRRVDAFSCSGRPATLYPGIAFIHREIIILKEDDTQ